MQELHYAQEQHSTSPLAPPIPNEPVKYTIQTAIFGPGNKFIESKKPKEPVYTELYHSTNPPAPPPAEVAPVQYATVKEPQTDNTVQPNTKKQESHYADLHYSTNPPAPPLPVEPVQYATVQKQTDNTETTQTKDKVSPIVMLCAQCVYILVCRGCTMLKYSTLLIHQLLLYLLNQYNMLLFRNKLSTLRLHNSLRTRSALFLCCVQMVCLQSQVQSLVNVSIVTSKLTNEAISTV